MEEHPARGRARELESAAKRFRSALNEPGPGAGARPGDADFAAMLPVLEYVLNTVCEAVEYASYGNADLATHQMLEEAREQLSGIFLADAQDGLDAAARAERVAQAAQTAWMAGTLHGGAGIAPAVTSDGDGYDWTGKLGQALAATLELQARSASSGPEDTETATAAAASYCDAYAEAAGIADARYPLCGYLVGYPVSTALGGKGTLTGDAGPGGHPRIRLDDGRTVTVPREAIREPLPHTLSSLSPAASRELAGNPCVVNGDILLSPSQRQAWIKTGDTWMHVDNYDPEADLEQFASVSRAIRVRASVPQPTAESTTDPGPRRSTASVPAPRFGYRPSTFPRARGTSRGGVSGRRRRQGP